MNVVFNASRLEAIPIRWRTKNVDLETLVPYIVVTGIHWALINPFIFKKRSLK